VKDMFDIRRGGVMYLGLGLMSLMASMVWQNMRIPSTTPQGFAIQFYQQTLGPLDGRSCPSYPVCSVYARQAYAQHGWLLASWLVMDRLIHEADDVHANHTVVFEGEKRFYDPLERNDFWLRE